MVVVDPPTKVVLAGIGSVKTTLVTTLPVLLSVTVYSSVSPGVRLPEASASMTIATVFCASMNAAAFGVSVALPLAL